jgi:hypothetical protein
MRIAKLHNRYRSGQFSGENTADPRCAACGPHWSSDKFEMWNQLRYDILFKGNDWKRTEKGTRLERLLGEVGASVHHFPYTASTSGTDLRRLLEGMS